MLASCFTSLPAVTKAVTVTKTPAVALFVHKLQMPLSDCTSNINWKHTHHHNTYSSSMKKKFPVDFWSRSF